MRKPIADSSSDAKLLGSSSGIDGARHSVAGRVARCTRPEIVSVFRTETRNTSAPRVIDWWLAKRIARYPKGYATTKITIATARDDDAAPRLDTFSNDDFAVDGAYR